MARPSYPRGGWPARAQALGVPELLASYRHLADAADRASGRPPPHTWGLDGFRTASLSSGVLFSGVSPSGVLSSGVLSSEALFSGVSPSDVSPSGVSPSGVLSSEVSPVELLPLEVPGDVGLLEGRILAHRAGREALGVIEAEDPDPRVRDRAWALLHPMPPRTLAEMPSWLAHPAFEPEVAQVVDPLYSVVLGEDRTTTHAEVVAAGLDTPGWSWLAGGPPAGSGPWPRRVDGTALTFLGQVDLRQLPLLHDWPALEPLGLPTSGFLQFFCDPACAGPHGADLSDAGQVRLVPLDQVRRAAGAGGVGNPEIGGEPGAGPQDGPHGPRAEWPFDPGVDPAGYPTGLPIGSPTGLPAGSATDSPTVLGVELWPSVPSWFHRGHEALAAATTTGHRPDADLVDYAATPQWPYSHLLGHPGLSLERSLDALQTHTWRTGLPPTVGDRTKKKVETSNRIGGHGRGDDPWILLADFCGARALESRFGHGGHCEFWIRSTDLRAGRLDRALALRQERR